MVRLREIQPTIAADICNEQSEEQSEKQSNEVTDIPIIRYHSQLEGLDEKVLEIKLHNYSNNFKQSLDKVLKLYPDEKLKYNSHLVSFVMYEVERYLLKPRSGKAKRHLVIDCVKKYFDDNDQIVGVVIDLLFKDLKQVKFIGRQVLKLMRFFSNHRPSH